LCAELTLEEDEDAAEEAVFFTKLGDVGGVLVLLMVGATFTAGIAIEGSVAGTDRGGASIVDVEECSDGGNFDTSVFEAGGCAILNGASGTAGLAVTTTGDDDNVLFGCSTFAVTVPVAVPVDDGILFAIGAIDLVKPIP
jgi:hypothetical protein